MPWQLDICVMSQDNRAPASLAQNIPTPHPSRQQFKSIISSRAGSSIPQDLCQKSSPWLKSNEQGRLWLCSGVGGCPQTRQKGKCAAAMGLVMMLHSSELPSEPGHSLGTQTPQLPSRSPPHPALQPIPLPCAFCFSISCPFPSPSAFPFPLLAVPHRDFGDLPWEPHFHREKKHKGAGALGTYI